MSTISWHCPFKCQRKCSIYLFICNLCRWGKGVRRLVRSTPWVYWGYWRDCSTYPSNARNPPPMRGKHKYKIHKLTLLGICMKFQLFTFQGSLENFVRLNTEVLGRFFTFSRILASLVSLISYPQKGIFCNNNITFFPISLHYVFSNKFVLHSNKSKNLMFNFFYSF